eukprot:GILK01005726.1.p1 GENE.GILK01005726.1~~GILK01005726.1.p1  ORF type:complete len:390 (+),score=74.93 GILK01005726.1:29-1171(+)
MSSDTEGKKKKQTLFGKKEKYANFQDDMSGASKASASSSSSSSLQLKMSEISLSAGAPPPPPSLLPPDSAHSSQAEVRQRRYVAQDVASAQTASQMQESIRIMSETLMIQAQQNLKSTALLMKLEMVLFKFRHMVYWYSILEAALFLFGLLFFFTDLQSMSPLWFHVLHTVRPFAGLALLRYLPATDNVLDELLYTSSTNEEVTVAFIQRLNGARMPSFAYFCLSLICLFLDSLGVIVRLATFQFSVASSPAALHAVFTFFFIATDIFVFLWIPTLKWSFPPETYLAIISTIKNGLFQAKTEIERKFYKGVDVTPETFKHRPNLVVLDSSAMNLQRIRPVPEDVEESDASFINNNNLMSKSQPNGSAFSIGHDEDPAGLV